jgi:APA family basic amino acid/polyamine antiporter
MAFNLSNETSWVSFNSAATMTLWSFIGLESAALSASQCSNPHRDIPRATIFGVLIAAALYIWSYIAIIGMIPFSQLMYSTAPYVDAVKPFLGNTASIWVAGFAAFSCLATLTGWVLIQGQIPLAAAKDKLFPAIFLKENKQNVPVAGLIISSFLITILLFLQANQSLVSQFTFIILLATLASLVPYFFTAMAALILFLKYSNRFNTRASILTATALAILAGLYAFWAIAGAGQSVVFYGCLLLLSSMPVYVAIQWSSAKQNIHSTTHIERV